MFESLVRADLYRMRGMLMVLAAATAANGTSLPTNACGEIYCSVRDTIHAKSNAMHMIG